MPYLETVQELLDDGTSLSTNLVLSWYELRTNLRETCDLTRKISIQVVGGIIDMGRMTSEEYAASQHKSNVADYVEKLYKNWYLSTLGTQWTTLVGDELSKRSTFASFCSVHSEKL